MAQYMGRMRWAGCCTVLGIVLGWLPAVAAAQGLKTGTIELAADTSGLTRDIDRRADLSTTGTAITLRPGYFLTDHLELVGSASFLQAEQVGGTRLTEKTTAERLGLDYHFPLREGQEIYPFVHGSLGYASTTSTTGAGAAAKTFQGRTYAVGAGLKIFLTDTSALRIQLTREQFEGEGGREITALALGYAIYFGAEQIHRVGAKQAAALLSEREALENTLTQARQSMTESAARQLILESELTDMRQAASARERTLETELAGLRDLVREKDMLAGRLQSLETLLAENRRPAGETDVLTVQLREALADLLKAKGSIAELEAQLQARREQEATAGQVRVALEVQAEALFEPGGVELAAGGRVELDRVLDTLKNVKGRRIVVEAHSDNAPVRGRLQQRYPTNWELSAARAMNMVRYLEAQGIPPALLSGLGYGEHAPLAPNDTEEGRRKNRRMRIVLMPIE